MRKTAIDVFSKSARSPRGVTGLSLYDDRRSPEDAGKDCHAFFPIALLNTSVNLAPGYRYGLTANETSRFRPSMVSVAYVAATYTFSADRLSSSTVMAALPGICCRPDGGISAIESPRPPTRRWPGSLSRALQRGFDRNLPSRSAESRDGGPRMLQTKTRLASICLLAPRRVICPRNLAVAPACD